MKKTAATKKEAFFLPKIGFGTYMMGGRFAPDHTDDEVEISAIRMAIECGYTHIDTAEMYGGGHCEELICEAMRRLTEEDEDGRRNFLAGKGGLEGKNGCGFSFLDLRKKLFITSKVLPKNLRYDDVIRACKRSLERLKIKQLDLYLIHAPNEEVPLKETMRAMDFLMEHGMTRFIGVSNFDVPLLSEAMAATKYGIVNNQIHFSLSARGFEENGTLDFCRSHGILVTAWRPVGRGVIEGERGDFLRPLAEKYGRSIAQIAINWVISQPNVVTLIKSCNHEHIRANLQAANFEMQQADIEMLSRDFTVDETKYLRL